MLSDLAAWADAWALWLGIAAAGVVLAYDLYFRWRLPSHATKDAHGSAHWAGRRELKQAGLLAKSGLYIGRLGRQPLRLATDRHIITFAPTRSGKGVSSILPNVLTYPGSMVIIDPKGETTAIAWRRRRDMGQRVHVVDPFGLTGLPVARYNPLALLDPHSRRLSDDAKTLAYALVPEVAEGAHWQTEARALVEGLILHVISAEEPELRTLGEVRRLLAQAPGPFQQTLANMAASQAAGGLVARAANGILQKADRERSGVISSARAMTHILDSPDLVDNLAASDFDFGEAKAQAMTVFIVLPADLLESYAKWLRLLVSQAIVAMIRRKGRPRHPVLFVLDEFSALGHLRPIEVAMGLLAGYGLQIWPILQDLAQLKGAYPATWPTFLANAGLLQAFGVAETTTAQWLSERLGHKTVGVRQQSLAGAALGADGPGRYSEGFGVISRPLLTADELMRLPADDELLIMPGRAPVRATKLTYYSDREFAGLFDANPWRQASA